MKFQTCTAILSRFVLASSISMFAVLPVAQADEVQVPVVSKKQLAPGETKTLNPQPIPPGKSNSTVKTSRRDTDKSIIFVGGKKAHSGAEAPAACCRGKPGELRHGTRNIRPEEKK